MTFNDYMFKDERTEDCAERAQQLLGISHIDSSSIDTSVEHSASKCRTISSNSNVGHDVINVMCVFGSH